MYKCNTKHTKFQATTEQWKCPLCGGNNEVFYIEEWVGDDECELLHEEDYVVCNSCEKEWSGKKLSTLMMKKANKKPCPHCKGTGVIDA